MPQIIRQSLPSNSRAVCKGGVQGWEGHDRTVGLSLAVSTQGEQSRSGWLQQHILPAAQPSPDKREMMSEINNQFGDCSQQVRMGRSQAELRDTCWQGLGRLSVLKPELNCSPWAEGQGCVYGCIRGCV